ncbi:O-antigen ligase family protein [Clostridium sp. YIM B02551]|uniref:O-antigen ligase family protein n=1 Tax=Clostridium sp. YIM B02551 TaxID=2910679 RepID=UPI001EECDB66|nr:O-antigen ligase family protein [Clostridium sp. YIM B02551]
MKEKLSNKTLILLMFILAISISIILSFYNPWIVISGLLYFAILILAVIFPIQVNTVILSTWFVFKGILMSIDIFGIPASQLIIFAIFLPLVISIIIRGKYLFRRAVVNKNIQIYSIMVVFSAIGVLTAPVKMSAFVLYLRLFIGLLYLLLFSKGVKNSNEQGFIINGISVTAFISSIITIIGFIAGTLFSKGTLGNIQVATLYYGGVYRPTGTAGGAVAQGILLYTFYIIILLKNNIKSKKNNSLLLVIVAIAILSTLTRTAILALIVSTIIYYFIYLRRKKNNLIKSLIFLIIIVVIYISLPVEIINIISKRFVDFQGQNTEDFGAGRFGIWIAVFKGIMNNANIFSILNGFGIDSARYFVANYSIFGTEDATHNDYLDMFISNGIIGLIIMILWLINIIKNIKLISNDKIKKLMYSQLITYIFVILPLSNTNYSTESRWSFLILISILTNYIQYTNIAEKLDKNL